MILTTRTGTGSYDIVIQPGGLASVGSLFDLDRKVLVVTDSGVPGHYADTVASACRAPVLATVPQGEGSKSFATWEELLMTMLKQGFTRTDCVVAVGGGVVGDLAGFVAASYMRGVDFYNIPTTVLSQVDSSIGGKTALDMGGIKNIVGAFYPPKKVLIDTELLATLPERQIGAGLAEAVKMALTFDAPLFEAMERGEPRDGDLLSKVIEGSLRIKKRVVEADEKEAGLRKVLNFGHTLGHGIESCEGLHGLYHGECVALGMLPMCSDNVRARLIPVLEKLHLPTRYKVDTDAAFEAICHDKKAADGGVTVVTVEEIGTYTLQKISLSSLRDKLSYYAL